MWKFRNPVDIWAGVGSLDRLTDLVGERRCVLVTFPEARQLGLVDRVSALLGNRMALVVERIQPNPDVSWLTPLYEHVHAGPHADAACIVALGGGSAIDTAKALLCATQSGRFDELLQALLVGQPLPPGPHKALIAVPTTAGTGSEVTPWATIWDQARGRKHSLQQPWTWPEAALIDPELMQSLPAAATLASGLDALSHALESIWNVNRNPVSTALAVTAARSIVETLPRLMRSLHDTGLRAAMAEAAVMAGLAFSNTKTALAHSLSYDITLRHGVAHGIACSFSLPVVLDMALGADAATDAALLSVFGTRRGDDAVQSLRSFLEGLGVATDPGAYGFVADEWDDMIRAAAQGPRGRNFIRQLA